MKKKLVALLGVGVLTISLLAGCAGGRGSATPTEPDETPGAEETVDDEADDENENGYQEITTLPAELDDEGEVTLIVWESIGGPDEFIRQAGAAFTALYPHITIEFQNVELGDATGNIAMYGPLGEGADVFAAPHDRLGELVAGGHILPVSNPDAVTQHASGLAITAVTMDGTLFGYTVSAETYALFYNRALIAPEDVPTSFEELVAMQNTWVPLDGSDARLFIMDVANAYYTILFSTSDGNRLFGPEGTDQSTPNMNTPEAIRGFEFFQSLRQYIDIAAEDLGTDAADAAFVGGDSAMHITGPWNVGPFADDGIDFGITTLPSLPGQDTPAFSFSGARAMFVSAYTRYPAEAEAFAAFLVTPEMQELRYEITGALPAISITIDDERAQGFVNQFQYAFPMPSIPAMGVFWGALNAASANIWNGGDVVAELNDLQEVLLDFVPEE